MRGKGGREGPDEVMENWSCAICLNLLLDPVVGLCGHDFCRACLRRWAQQAGPRRAQGAFAVRCPLCRAVLCDDDVDRLGVCVRLKRAVEQLFPETIAQRRREAKQLEDEADHRLSEKQRAEALTVARAGRTRFLRVRRTRPQRPLLTTPPYSLAVSPTQSQQGREGRDQDQTSHAPTSHAGVRPSVAHVLAHAPVSSRGPVGALSSSAAQGLPVSLFLAQALAQGMSGFQPMHVGDFEGGQSGLAALGGGAWAEPPEVTFTMGWFESNADSRQRKRQERSTVRSASARLIRSYA